MLLLLDWLHGGPESRRSSPKYLSNEASAWELLERLRWPDGEPVCPHCGTKDAKHYFISAKSGERKTKAGKVTYRRLWRCRDKACRKQFSVMVGTIFESSKIPASKWLLAMWLMGAGKNSISALELQRHLAPMSYQTAWFWPTGSVRPCGASQCGLSSPARSLWTRLSVGGAPKNRHQQGRPSRLPDSARRKGPHHDKSAVVALISKETGEARTGSWPT